MAVLTFRHPDSSTADKAIKAETTSREQYSHLGISDPDNEKMSCNLSDSKGNNYEPMPANEGSIDFYWTSPANPRVLKIKFVIDDESGM